MTEAKLHLAKTPLGKTTRDVQQEKIRTGGHSESSYVEILRRL